MKINFLLFAIIMCLFVSISSNQNASATEEVQKFRYCKSQKGAMIVELFVNDEATMSTRKNAGRPATLDDVELTYYISKNAKDLPTYHVYDVKKRIVMLKLVMSSQKKNEKGVVTSQTGSLLLRIADGKFLTAAEKMTCFPVSYE